MLKSVADQDLVAACRAAMRGEPFLYAGAISALIRDYLMRSRQNDRLPESILTPREEEIVKLIAEGNSSKEIAATLVISIKTVDRHRANILGEQYTKIGVGCTKGPNGQLCAQVFLG